MLSNIVDKVFLITTINSERYTYISSHLKDNNIHYQIIVAPDYNIIDLNLKVLDSGNDTRCSVSLLSAYQSIFEISKLCKYNKIAVIEDDCFFIKDWESLFINFYKSLPDSWDILNIGYYPSHDNETIKEIYNQNVYIPKSRHYTTHCMLVNNTVFKELLNLIERSNYKSPIDYIFSEVYMNLKYKSFCPTQRIVYQLSTRDKIYSIPNTDLRFKSFIN